MIESVPNISTFLYDCKFCGFKLNAKKHVEKWNIPKTQTGHYGQNCTPAPQTWSPGGIFPGEVYPGDDEAYPSSNEWYSKYYNATTISFQAASGDDPAQILDSANQFGEKGFISGENIHVSTDSETNDGNYTIARGGVARGVLSLVSTDSLTTETAATAGWVTILERIYRPDTTPRGCPLCGSLNSR